MHKKNLVLKINSGYATKRNQNKPTKLTFHKRKNIEGYTYLWVNIYIYIYIYIYGCMISCVLYLIRLSNYVFHFMCEWAMMLFPPLGEGIGLFNGAGNYFRSYIEAVRDSFKQCNASTHIFPLCPLSLPVFLMEVGERVEDERESRSTNGICW